MLTDEDCRRVRAWLWAEVGQAPDETGAEVAALLDTILGDESPAVLGEALRDEEVAVGAAWVARFGPISTDEQFAAIVRTAALGRRRRERGRGAVVG